MATLKTRFEEMINLTWTEFLDIESDETSSIDDSVICSLVRACADTDDISAIKLAFDRIDGLLETPIEINVPKFYIRYVNAKSIEGGSKGIEAPEDVAKEKTSSYDPATAKLRETLVEMRSMPRNLIRVVRSYKTRIEKGKPVEHSPRVKSVIVANLLRNVVRGKFKAIELVFDQIDGKLIKTITLLGGEDVYVDDYTIDVAPQGSLTDDDGVYYSEDKAMNASWLRGFAKSRKGLEILAEGLEDD